jgi:O-antigen ligase
LPEVLAILCLLAVAAKRWMTRRASAPASVALPAGDPIGEQPLRISIADAGLALLVLAALVSTTAARELRAALFELRSVFLMPAAYYALMRFAPLNGRGRRRIVDGYLLGAIGVALVGVVQVGLGRNLVVAEGGLRRLQSVYPSPNNVGLYLGRAWPFLAVGALMGEEGRRRAVAIAGLVLVTAAVALSFSRGAILLALPAAILVMGWWAGGKYRWKALALVGVLALVLLPMMRLPRFAALFDLGEGTTFLRLKLWQSSVRMIGDNPLLGVGPGNFLEAYRSRYILPAAWEEFNLEHAHNALLDHWTRLGMLGVAAGVTAQVGFWRAVGRRRRVVALSLVGSMAAGLAHGLVDNAFFFPDLALTFALTLALAQRGWR